MPRTGGRCSNLKPRLNLGDFSGEDPLVAVVRPLALTVLGLQGGTSQSEKSGQSEV